MSRGEHPHVKLRHMVDALFEHARKHNVLLHLKLRFPDGARFEHRSLSPRERVAKSAGARSL